MRYNIQCFDGSRIRPGFFHFQRYQEIEAVEYQETEADSGGSYHV